ncbi:MAG: hypothetical protein WCO63_15210 [Bacteroidota bacterium]
MLIWIFKARAFFYTALLLLPLSVFAQYDFSFPSDSDFVSYNTQLLGFRNSNQTKENDFELRIWFSNGIAEPSIAYLFDLTNRKGKWMGYFYSFMWKGNGDYITKSRKIKNANLDSLFIFMYNNHLLTIPSQNVVITRLYMVGKQKISIADGDDYRFELFTPLNKRWYRYHCPKIYSYNYDDSEYQDVVKILNRIMKIVGFGGPC